MIHNKTARDILYNWHSGQSSPFYTSASSGLCASFADLAIEADHITDTAEKTKLLTWIMAKQKTAPEILMQGRAYRVLPWVSRTYYPKVVK